MAAIVEAPALSASDRCDRCGAPAFVRAELPSGHGELLFCAHHSRLHEARLRELRAVISDRSGRTVAPGTISYGY